jgi:hypothetical protein
MVQGSASCGAQRNSSFDQRANLDLFISACKNLKVKVAIQVNETLRPAANPTALSYNASATNSRMRFYFKKIYDVKAL